MKLRDIQKLISEAEDAYRASRVTRKQYYNALMIVTNQGFDGGALAYANDEGVMCILFDGQGYVRQNDPPGWLGKPAWLRSLVQQLR